MDKNGNLLRETTFGGSEQDLATALLVHQLAKFSIADVTVLTEDIVVLFPERSQFTLGVTALPVNGLLLRILDYKAEELFALLKVVAQRLPAGQQIPVFKSNAHVS